MSKVHLTARGKWVACAADTRACPRRIHLPDVTPAEVALIPRDILDTFIEIADPPTIVKEKNGNKVWMIDGKPGRVDDLPAIITGKGERHWYLNGRQGRILDLPAEVHPSGFMRWYKDGLEHRDGDKPAVMSQEGKLQWKREGRFSRDFSRPSSIDLPRLAMYLRHEQFEYPARQAPGTWMTDAEIRQFHNAMVLGFVGSRGGSRVDLRQVLRETKESVGELPQVLRDRDEYRVLFQDF